jgi:uncharacterized membrane protein
MFEAIDRHAPEDPTHRLVAGVAAAVVGILAVGDALNVIYFPMYQLGLPDAAWANFIVLVFGVTLMVVTYRLVQTSVGEVESGVATTPAADGGYDDRDPEQILETRFARGELSEDEFEEMKAHLADFGDGSATGGSTDAGGSPTRSYDSPQEFAENHELHDRETIID